MRYQAAVLTSTASPTRRNVAAVVIGHDSDGYLGVVETLYIARNRKATGRRQGYLRALRDAERAVKRWEDARR